MDQVSASPGENRFPEYLLNNDIGHEAGMSAVSVGKTMDGHNPVLEPDGDFIITECFSVRSFIKVIGLK